MGFDRTDARSGANLAEHTKEFARGVVEAAPGVHVAIGYGLANSILIEGEGGHIVVDTLESAEAAEPVKQAFAAITDTPLAAIIYTHNHTDHVLGARVFAGDAEVPVISHTTTLKELDQIFSVLRPITYARAMRQFGTALEGQALENAGIGPFLLSTAETTPAHIRPDDTFAGEHRALEIAGVKLDLFHAPGETPDHVVVWLPERKVLIAADNYYKTFPNLYAIRGTTTRDVMSWVRSLDLMRGLGAEVMVPCHTRPVTGAAEIGDRLTNYRDAIQFVHDQTVKLINRGLIPDEIVERVQLPEHLAKLPYLHEYYGKVAWSVRAIFDGYLGWFDGNATNLHPTPPGARAEKLAALAGGAEKLRAAAQTALDGGDPQWACELADPLLALDPEDAAAKAIKVAALTALGENEINANGRHYYLTQAKELAGELDLFAAGRGTVRPEMARALPLANLYAAMSLNLDAAAAAGEDICVHWHFPDTGEDWSVHVRNCVAAVQPARAEDAHIRLSVDSTVWKEIAVRIREPAQAFQAGDIRVEGEVPLLLRFLQLFRRPGEGN
jgi:alkyl sulfatase BDS1-like metallo-beta-lactamase superfamily hydrolase